MVKAVVLFLIVLALAVMPVYMFDTYVLADLTQLKHTYQGVDSLAAQAAGEAGGYDKPDRGTRL